MDLFGDLNSIEALGNSLASQMLGSFILGILSTLTPCVYPLIPVTLAIFGADKSATRIQAFFRSLTYVIGIALTYTALGLISAKTGQVFGTALGNPYVIVVLCLFLFALMLVTLDVVELSSLQSLQRAGSKVGGSSKLGILLMGIASGLVAAPCIGPIVVLLIGFAAKSGSSITGGLLLFSYGLGIGVPFLILGTFSSLVSYLPRSGNWLLGVKTILAGAIAGYMIHLLGPLLPRVTIQTNWPVIGIVTAIVGLLITRFGVKSGRAYLKVVAALLIGVGSLAAIKLFPPGAVNLKPGAEAMEWRTDIDAALKEASETNKKVIIDFFADWCFACHELDRYTYSDPAVVESLSSYIRIKYDLTEENEKTAPVVERFGVLGLPTVIFLKPDGTEFPDTRVSGFEPPEKFLSITKKLE